MTAAGADAEDRVRVAEGGRATRLTVATLAAITLLFLGLPVATLVVRAITGGAIGRTQVGPLLDALVLSLCTSLIAVTLVVMFGSALAWILARRAFRGKALAETLVDLPIVLPPSVAGLALLLLLGRNGVLGAPLHALGIELPFTTAAVVVAQSFVAAPFFIRSARTGFAGVDHDLEDAARVDGASELALFRRITVPLASSALAAGLVMAWARALGEFGATIMFAGNVEGHTQTLPLVVYSEFQAGNLDTSVAAAAILVLAAFGVLVAVRLLHWGRILDVRSVAG